MFNENFREAFLLLSEPLAQTRIVYGQKQA